MDQPETLKREAAGIYRTADERFSIRSDGGRWFLIDTEQADELGQQLIRGPYATRDDARAEIAAARSAKVMPIRAAKSSASKPAPGARAKPKPRPKPHRTWIDRLPAAEASRVRGLIGALEKEGISDADTIVRRDREGLAPAIAQRLIERRLAELIEDLPAAERFAAERLVRRAAAIVAGHGQRRASGLPGWLLVEVGPEPDPPNRRINLSE